MKDGTRRAYWYHRATGKRLRGEPGSADFIADYAAAEKLIRDRHAGTLNSLIRDYTTSIEFEQKLAASTQAEYKRMLTKSEAEFGTMPIAALDDARVRKDLLEWREKVARSSGQREADNRLSAISAMLTWGVDRGTITTNHLKGFKRLYHVDRSEIIWLPEHIAAFMSVASLEMQQALILGLHTGQREGDILRMPWSAYDGASISLRQGKRRRGTTLAPLVHIPCTAALRRMLDGMERISPLILTTKTGQSFKSRYFGRLWEEATKKAGLESVTLPGSDEAVDLHFHDLRGTAVTLLSEAGCTPQQIATITGHSLKTVHRILERYLARTRGLAEQAMMNFENSPRTKFANQLQTSPSRPKSKKGKGVA
ncbi:tyrosine-type recombinase/integrase [Bradyrhizobium elkanii]|uniref:tyrosine-type recombinase/integrase n=1 Tax=Bradyrhizobium elkanii TaxID=29448 RepID=UPI001AED404D|nr:tyrosine-type recombinase/integrase [Bradyrhizobium elkanii]MCP1754385.1 integrase [Bradyrhizobium elkanii]MCP1979905.1 integrase [Bradyrhizobium elkanii]MCS3885318.1 integrase [Bradyrhizobium elkanii]MCS4215656.1 integrase [Bradyrhizobium elkanii]MCW2188755.1 integrase [Bradyrhizobium elkanii]